MNEMKPPILTFFNSLPEIDFNPMPAVRHLIFVANFSTPATGSGDHRFRPKP
jgi:hypothetical protein